MASVFIHAFLQSNVSGHKFSDKLWNMVQWSGLRLDWPRVTYGDVWSVVQLVQPLTRNWC